MLVFVSDFHLNDGSTGDTIEPGAFRRFAAYVKAMTEAAGAREINLILLGDIFDVIRSKYWYKTRIRPWSKESDRDRMTHNLRQTVCEILRRICLNRDNRQSMQALRQFREEMAAKGIPVHLRYLIGNDDWLINRYPEARIRAADFLGLDNPQRFASERFETERFWPEYQTFARHGDIHDPLSFDGNRDAPSLGDAVVIDLLNKFSDQATRQLAGRADEELLQTLRGIDYVRPLVDVPLLVRGACMRVAEASIAEEVRAIWDQVVDDFLQIDFVRNHDIPWRLDFVDALQFGLKLSRHLSVREIAKLPLRRLQRDPAECREAAFNEDRCRRNEAEFVVYAHTHVHDIAPLDQVPLGESTLQKTYFNTGTWRKVYVPTEQDRESLEFMNWHTMSILAIYLPAERANRRFEVIHAALGPQRKQPTTVPDAGTYQPVAETRPRPSEKPAEDRPTVPAK